MCMIKIENYSIQKKTENTLLEIDCIHRRKYNYLFISNVK